MAKNLVAVAARSASVASDSVEAAGVSAPVVPPPPRTRRKPVWMAIAAVLITVGSLLTWFTVNQVRATVSVVAVRSDIERGATISRDKLTTVEINAGTTLSTVPASQLESVVGKRATVDLLTGSLVSQASVADTLIPAAGQSVVGLALNVGQLPAVPLKVGDKVRIISTPRAQDEAPFGDPGQTISAVVVSTSKVADSSVTVVDVSVFSAQAATVAGVAATGRVALILESSQS